MIRSGRDASDRMAMTPLAARAATRVIRYTRATLSVLLLSLAACPDDCYDIPDNPGSDSPVTGVVLTPNAVDVASSAAGSAIALRAVVTHADGTTSQPPAGSMLWKADGGAAAGGSGELALVTLPATLPAMITVTATYQPTMMSSTAQLTSVSATSPDAAATSQATVELPRVAIAGGLSGGDCTAGAVKAFVGLGRLPNVVGQSTLCAGFGTVLATRSAPWYGTMGWHAGQDWLPNNGGVPTSDAPVLELTARVVLGMSSGFCDYSGWYTVCYSVAQMNGLAKFVVNEQLSYANLVFQAYRTGVRLQPDQWVTSPMAGLKDCETVPLPDAARPETPRSHGLTIYVVEHITDLPRAVTCHHAGIVGDGPDEDYKVIVIGYGEAVLASTLAHELGHAMSLRWPRHVNEAGVTGFGEHNIMSTVSSTGPDRFHLTLGQVHRMVADVDSWVNKVDARPGAATAKCQCDGDSTAPRSCPALALDLPGMATSGSVPATACSARPNP